MPKRTNEFQQVVLRLYEALAGATATVEESVLVQEKNSSAKREIDVLVTTAITGHKIRVAVECRDHEKDQDITWVDGLIGKYANLDIQKIIAVSRTGYSATALQKAAQHNIELLTLKEAESADWSAKVGPAAFQFFAFRNRPLIVGLSLGGAEQAKIEYTFEGELTSTETVTRSIASFFLDAWQYRMVHVAGLKISEHVFSNWARVSASPSSPRYCEIVEKFATPRVLDDGIAPAVSFDTIVWGVGTKYTAETITPTAWEIGDKAAVLASVLDDQGKTVHITLVTNKSGQLLGARVESKDLGAIRGA